MASAAMKFVSSNTAQPFNPFRVYVQEKSSFAFEGHDSSRSYEAKERTRSRQALRRLKRSSFEASSN